jgi:membrane protease YdiL (CAAX protease family)
MTIQRAPAAPDASLGPENHLIGLARRARRLPNVVVVLVVGSAILLGGQLVVGLPGYLAILALTGQEPRSLATTLADSATLSGLYQTFALIASFSGVYLLVWLWVRRYERRPFWTLGFEPDGAIPKVLRGALVGLLMLGGAVGLMAIMGYVTFEDGPAQLQGSPALAGVLIILVGWAVQGPAEELLCRGWMLPVLGARYRVWVGVAVSSAFFAVLHMLNPNPSLIALLNLTLYGVFAALYALREGGLWGIAAQHAVWNWAQGNLFGFEVSGFAPAGGMLLNLMETGPDEITGGPFGPEGGFAMTAVLLIGIAALLIRGGRGRGKQRTSPVP